MNFLDNMRYRISTFSIAEKIILFNVFCFLVPMLLNTVFFLLKVPSGAYMNWIQLSPKFDTFITRPWTLISYSFFHSNFFHLLWNMLLLFYSGRLLLNLFPDKIMPDKIIKKSRRLISKEYFFGKFLKKRGIVKKANKENL